MSTSKYRLQRLKKCANCGHHVSIHAYDPKDEGRSGPHRCGVPGCACREFRRPVPGERIAKPNGGRDESWVAAERSRLSRWTRGELVAWLKWADPNGDYEDEGDTGWGPISKDDALDHVMEAVEENRATPEEMRRAARRNPSFRFARGRKFGEPPTKGRYYVEVDPEVIVEVKDYAEASKSVRLYIERTGMGSTEWYGLSPTIGRITFGSKSGKAVARVSYNGRVWTPDEKKLLHEAAR